jgi:hypothetical protein
VLAVVRIVGLLAAVALAAAVLAWLVTGDRRWLRLARRIFTVTVFALVLLLLLFAGEALIFPP